MPEHLTESDEQLDLKKRARRRLIGAAVFASTAAVILPMVMDRDPPPAMPHIELRIPAQDKTSVAPQAASIKSQAVVTPAPAPVVPTIAEPVASVAPAPTAQQPAPTIADAVVSKPKPDPKVPVKAEPKIAKPEPKAPAKPDPKLAVAEPKKVEPAIEAKRAQAILEGKEAGSAETVHVVLIGAFKEAGNVEILKKKIGEMGIKVYTETWESPQGKRIRVRAGPFPSRDAAERAAERIKSIGVTGVVAPKS